MTTNRYDELYATAMQDASDAFDEATAKARTKYADAVARASDQFAQAMALLPPGDARGRRELSNKAKVKRRTAEIELETDLADASAQYGIATGEAAANLEQRQSVRRLQGR